MKKLKKFLRQETVLAIAVMLAVLSAFGVHPDKKYMDYIDFRTLGILFSLMTVMMGLQRQGVFEQMGQALLARTKRVVQLVLVLVVLCFFGSMFITNDVALMTFVPFTFVVLSSMGKQVYNGLALPVVCMQTIAANLGSMLTPIGNPQNLYLYGKSGMKISHFVSLMLPYTIFSLLLLVIWAILLCRRYSKEVVSVEMNEQKFTVNDRKLVTVYLILFVVCLLSVIHIVPYEIVLIAVLTSTILMDRVTLRKVDYSLLLTFTAFFVFIGNLGRLTIFSEWLQKNISGHECLVAVLASQVTSNVPAALLLSNFTDNIEALIVGTNIGGLGTLIASMASLISYRQIVREMPQDKGKYFKMFTASNIIFLAALSVVYNCLT